MAARKRTPVPRPNNTPRPPKRTRSPLDSLWARYRRRPTEELRNELALVYLPLVERIAKQMFERLPPDVDLADLVNEGAVGMLDAIGRFEPQRGLQFNTFATIRIRGRILDFLRGCDHVGRKARSDDKRLRAATAAASHRLGKAPTDEELAVALEVDEADVHAMRVIDRLSIDRSYVHPLDAGPGNATTLSEILPATSRSIDPADRLRRRDSLRRATRGLRKDERLLIILYYWEGLTMKEIGETLDLSESRVSQLHSSIIEQLRAKFRSAREAALN